jgi:CheY-like chemotaxis protein
MNPSERQQTLVLVVDHDQAVQDEIAAVLGQLGVACHSCLTAEAAVQLAPLLLPDLIIADVSLQGTSGVEVCAQIKQDEALADVPVMFLSAGQIPDIIRRHDGGKGAYYLRKPLDRRVLLQLIEGAFAATPEAALANEP